MLDDIWNTSTALSSGIPQLRLDIPEKMLPFFTTKTRFKVAKGGRGGAKSWSIARLLIAKAFTEPNHLILCTREYQTSIADSVHKLLASQIQEMGLGIFFDVQDKIIRCRLTNSTFIFKGLRRNINEIKSTEGITVCWVEEAQAVSEHSWVVLIPTVRGPGSEIWVSYNPCEDDDPTHKRFALADNPDAMLVTINWDDNPWFPAELEKDRRFMLRTDPDAYDWVWGGQTRHVSEATIFRGRFSIEPFEVPEIIPRFMHGADWGFANDPTVMMRCWVEDGGPGKKFLRIDHEAYGIGVEIDDLPSMFAGGKSNKVKGMEWPGIPTARDWPCFGDNARPETISYVKRQGFNMKTAQKWKGCVEDGIAHLKQYDKIIIHPRCVHMAQEARLYSYEVDERTGLILPKVADKHNHCWDAIRYAHDGLITRGGSFGTWQKLGKQLTG